MRAPRSILTAALVAGALAGIIVTVSTNRQSCAPAGEEVVPAVLPVTVPGNVGSFALPNFAKLVEQLSPSVVNISTISEQPELTRRHGPVDPFEFFFRRRGPRKSLGSGFILDKNGYIITNHHVVEDATKVVVKLQDDDKEHEAEIIGSDAKTDIAVIKIKKVPGLVPVALGDSDSLQVGDWVLAIGNPFGLDHTVTAGIVSAKGRRINRPDESPYDDFIQTDAAINPGNSGGPLVNLAGQVVGINSAIFSRSGGNIGIGFAIPVNMARQIVPQLKEHGHVTRGWLGVLIQPVSEDIAKSLHLPETRGALVAKVYPDSPAEESGIEIGDVIVSFDGQKVFKSTDLPSIVANTPVGKKVKIEVVRKGKKKRVAVTVAKLEEGAVEGKPVKAEELGLAVQDITPDMAKELKLGKGAKGVVVTSVVRSSPAEAAGIQPGDVIEMVGNSPVHDVGDFRRLLAEREKGQGVLVLVRRGDQTLFRVIKPSDE